MRTKILIGVVIFLVLIQFIQPPHNNGTPESATDITHTIAVPDTVMSLLKVSCYDCHSNHTDYPWYSKITPVNWWLNNHINEGKRELNFSTFSTGTFKRKDKKMKEIDEQIDKHEMPLDSYLWIHKDAKLNDAQRKLIIDWTKTAREKIMQDSLAARSL